MKVHPAPKRRNIAFPYDINSNISEAISLMGSEKKLRRLPHSFNKVLELPLRSDADVSIEEHSNCLRFVATTDDVSNDLRAHTVEIHPGVTKTVIRGSTVLELPLAELELEPEPELELDRWRFRLPQSARPELASVVFVDGKLVVTVPTAVISDNPGSGNREDEEVRGEGNDDLRGDVSRLVTVQ